MSTFLPICKKVAVHVGHKGRSLLLLAALGLPALSQAQVVFPRNASFTGTETSGFTLGGNAFLTTLGSAASNGNVSGTKIDNDGSGVLRLTNAVGNQAGYAIDNSVFSTPNGFSISFEFFSYGTTTPSPADGFSVFLVDGAGTTPGTAGFAIGGFGGSLGYAPRVQGTTTEPGVTKGYLGIGIDEYGNYGIPSEGRIGGYPGKDASTLLPNAVSLRGPYDPTDLTYKKGYAYLAGSGSLPFKLAVGTSNTNTTTQGSRITDPTDTGYRKAYINVIPVTTNGSIVYKITVRIQNGQNVTTAVNNITVTNPPSTLRVGFGASTGGSTSIHEIRGLAIVQAPIANDDNVATKYNQAVKISVLNNDLSGGGANIDPTTVDLNPSTIDTDNTYTVAQGTFTVDASGVVTFAPKGDFSGTFSIPYTVQNLNKNISNPGTITVIVTGADVETVVSGPKTINPGTTTSYTLTTFNNGIETATNVIPTLTLPAGATYVSGGTLSGNTVSFPQTTLTARKSATNSVVITWPTAGSYGLTSNYTYPSGAVVPDALASNNSSTLNVTVQGSANIAGMCAVPGKDGLGTLTATSQPNTYYPGQTAVQGSKTIIVGTTPTGNTATPIAAGDLLLIMQMQGATMTTTNTVSYGTVTAATAGKYEYAVASSAVNASNGSLALAAALVNGYTNSSTSNTRFQVIRVPQYSTLSITGTVKGLSWNGSTGGILALEVAGQTDLTNGTLNMDGTGFRGGAGIMNSVGGSTDTYVTTSTSQYGTKGEGIGGTPAKVFDGSSTFVTVAPSNYQDYANGSYARGKAATGGGGGTYAATNAIYGGGGGANGGTGGAGESPSSTPSIAGGGGGVSPTPTATTLYLGGGGGAGASSATTSAFALSSSGGIGGGIIILRSGSVIGTATISANGKPGSNLTLSVNPGGGGGAGGTVVLKATAIAGLANLTVTANGGNGTQTTGGNSSDGGGGGGGVVFSNGALNTASSVAAGANGIGATSGIANASTTIGVDCLPALTTTLSTTTPTLARSNSMQAAYMYTVSNTGGGITGLTATPNLAVVGGSANLFTYVGMSSSAVIQLTDGTTKTLTEGSDYNVTGSGSTPTFTLMSSVVVPSGASVVFTFLANIANAAVTGTPYGSNVSGSYLDPQRATATAMIATPVYTSTSTSADVVTIVVPLPVKLTKFTVAAVGTDAILNWETAQEVNNRYFEVERSLDGQTFESVRTVAGNGTTMLTQSYRYTDAGVGIGTANLLYYRLRQVDYDGQSSFSPVRTVQFRHTGASVALYPNPTTNSATLDLSQLPAGDYAVQVFETTGRLVQRATYQAGKQMLPLESLPTGTYFVKVQGASFNTVLSLIKQ
jgi:hypothetical protein